MFYLVVLTLVFALYNAKGIKRGVPEKVKSAHIPETKIVNGIPTTNSKYPWIVSLRTIGSADGYNDFDEGHFCGGSIIEMNNVPMVLTAAHCVDDLTDSLKDSEKWAKEETGEKWDFEVYADIGRTNVKRDEGTYDRIKVANWYQHQNYDPETVANDVAIMALSSSIDTSDAPNATAVTYNVETTLNDGEMLRVIGYGYNISSDISYNYGYTPTLEYTNISYVEPSTCNDYQNLFWYLNATEGIEYALTYNWSNPDFSLMEGWDDYDENIILDGMICGFDVDSDSCQGDSGGPVVNLPLTKDATQIGVVSWGLGCAWGIPGVYSSVDYYLNWINGAKSCLACIEDSDSENSDGTSDGTSDGSEDKSSFNIETRDSLSYCKKSYSDCQTWVKDYGKPVDRYSSSNHHNASDVIVIVAVILSIAVICGVIACVAAYIRRRRKRHDTNDLYSSLTEEQEMTHGHSHGHGHSHSHGHDHHHH